jgi:hypothetical protein
MDWKIWAGYIALVTAVGALVFLRRRGVERALDRAADVAGLGVPPEIRPLLLRRTRAVQIATGAGAVAGMTLGAFLSSTPLGEPIRYYALQGSVVLGGGVGIAVGGLVAARALPTAGRRVARARAVQVADYISPVERRGALVAMLIVVVFCVLASTFGASRSRVALDVCAAIAVADWIGFELVARRIVARPQAADTALQLAWDDALRAGAIRRLAGSSAAIAMFALLASIWFETSLVLSPSDAEGVVFTCVVGVAAVLLVIRFWLSAAEPGRYFRDRLWPDTVAYAPETVAR